MNPVFPSSLLLALSTLAAAAQGTLVFDQQSSSDETLPNPGIGWNSLQDFQSGQSFTPALTGVDFIKLMLTDAAPNDGLGVPVHIDLRSGSIYGTLLGTTASVQLPNQFSGPATFLFANQIPLTAGDTYYFNVVPEPGGSFGIYGSRTYNYPGGTAFAGGFANPNGDLWFREGVIAVPEPSSAALLLVGGLVLFFRRRAK